MHATITLDDVRRAGERIAPYLRPTALYPYPGLAELLDAEVWVKHENHQPVGAFKVRGGVNLVAQLSDEERRAGLIAASTGNHGQSIAYAARLFDVPARICVPSEANPVKVASMKALGAELIFHGDDYDDARERCEELAAAHGYRYVHSGNEPHLIAGVATETLEIFDEQADLDAIFVPIGGGSGAAGACIVAKSIRPQTQVIGVQSEAAPAAYRSWRERRLLEAANTTFAEGLATRTSFELPQQILWEQLDDFVLVREEELREATLLMIEHTRNLVEPAGAAALAGARKRQVQGQRVALILSGGNISPAQLAQLLT